MMYTTLRGSEESLSKARRIAGVGTAKEGVATIGARVPYEGALV
jgi:hypothetical protein